MGMAERIEQERTKDEQKKDRDDQFPGERAS